MPEQNALVIILSALTFVGLCFAYFFTFQIAISTALKEGNTAKSLWRWIFLIFPIAIIISYALLTKPFSESRDAISYHPSDLVNFFIVMCIIYVLLEVPYQLVKMAAAHMADEINTIADDKRQAARLKSAQELASIISEKLSVRCELQACSNNDEFIFLSYIVDNRPIATRLTLNQADRAENWKKLGDWLIQNYQKDVVAKQ